MKDKKGFLFGIIGIVYLVLILLVLILTIWFGFKISAFLSAILLFVKNYWWAILIGAGVLLFRQQVRAVLNTILKRVGVRV